MRKTTFPIILVLVIAFVCLVIPVVAQEMPSPLAKFEYDEYIADVDWCPDSSCFAIAFSNGSVEIRQSRTLEIIDSFDSKDLCETSTYTSLGWIYFSPSGRYLILECLGGRLLIRDTYEDKKAIQIYGDIGFFSPDEAYLLTRVYDNSDVMTSLWNVATWEFMYQVEGQASWNYDLTLLISNNYDSYVKIYDAVTGALKTEIDFTTPVKMYSTSPFNNFVAFATDRVTLWDIDSLEMVADLGATSSYTYVDFTKDQILTDPDNTFHVWDATTLEKKFSLLTEETNYRGGISINYDETLVLGDIEMPYPCETNCENWLYVWELGEGRILSRKQYMVDTLAPDFYPQWRPATRQLVTYNSNNSVILWDVETGETITTFQADDSLDGFVLAPDGKAILLWTYDTVLVWNIP